MKNRITIFLIVVSLLCVLSGCLDTNNVYDEFVYKLYKHYDDFYVSGPQSTAAIDNFKDACIVIINPTQPDGEYAMVCNVSLWGEDSMNNTEYASWINKEEFDSILTYNEESCCYLTESLPHSNVSYNIDYDNEDTYEEIGRYYKYLARLIKLHTGEIVGVVLDYRAGYGYEEPSLGERLFGQN